MVTFSTLKKESKTESININLFCKISLICRCVSRILTLFNGVHVLERPARGSVSGFARGGSFQYKKTSNSVNILYLQKTNRTISIFIIYTFYGIGHIKQFPFCTDNNYVTHYIVRQLLVVMKLFFNFVILIFIPITPVALVGNIINTIS